MTARVTCLNMAGVLALVVCSAVCASLSEDEVLVVYNSDNAASLAVFDHYQAVRPGVRGFDLKSDLDALGVMLPAGNIGYADFVAKVRDPVRNFLATNNLSHEIVVLTLTKGIPHRIRDMGSVPNIGDSPGSVGPLFAAGNASYASVDAELTLLWQDLDSGEAGGSFDSRADNFVANPYYDTRIPITTFSRSDIDSAKQFEMIQTSEADDFGWQMFDDLPNQPSDGGDMYLVTRLDGDTIADVTASIDRAQRIRFRPQLDRIILDQNMAADLDDPSMNGDYDRTTMLLAAQQYAAVTHDTSSDFLVGANGTVGDPKAQAITGPVAVLASHGGNHGASPTLQNGFIGTFDGQLVDGAIMNTLESYNGRPFAGLLEFADQGSLAEWLKSGGTLGVGNVWEPFEFSVSDNHILVDNFLFRGLTWAEAAWSSIPGLSWQQTVVGDPLAIVPEPAGLVILAGAICLLGRTLRR